MNRGYYLKGEYPLQLEGSLKTALQQAMVQCPGTNEEEGGVILQGPTEFEFIKLRNQHTGTPVAVGFFEADREEYGQLVIPRFDAGLKNFASFHTHPTGCRAMPSTIDLTRLFNGFPINFICSPSMGELYCYTHRGSFEEAITWGVSPVLF